MSSNDLIGHWNAQERLRYLSTFLCDRCVVTFALWWKWSARLLPIALHHVLGPHRRAVGVLAGVAPGPALAQEVPTLVEGDLDVPQAPEVGLRQRLACV